MSQSLEICEGLEEWAGQQELSNCSDTEEEEGTQLVGDGTPRGLPLPALFSSLLMLESWPCPSEIPCLSVGNERVSQPEFPG